MWLSSSLTSLHMQITTVAFIWVFHWITAGCILPASFVLARDSFSCSPMALLCDADFQHQACEKIIFICEQRTVLSGVLNGTRNCEKLEINRLNSPRDAPLAVKFPFYYIRKISKNPKWLINVFIHVLVQCSADIVWIVWLGGVCWPWGYSHTHGWDGAVAVIEVVSSVCFLGIWAF